MNMEEPDREALEKAERLRAFCDGTKPESDHADLSIGLSVDEYHQREAAKIDAALDWDDDAWSALEKPRNIKGDLRQAIEQAQAKIIAENEAKRVERNARRWREQRDPVEYNRQKIKQRADYAAQIAADEGREVRAYAPVLGKTRAEHDENAKARDAARKRASRSKADQVQKDKDADRTWTRRMRKNGWTDQQIAQGLAKRAADRYYRRPEPVAYEDNPNFGLF